MADMADVHSRDESMGREWAVTVSFPRQDLLSQRKHVISLLFWNVSISHEAKASFDCSNLIPPNTKPIWVILRQRETSASAARSFCASCYFEFLIPSCVSSLPVKAYWSTDGGTHFSFQGMKVDLVLALSSRWEERGLSPPQPSLPG